MIPQRTNQKTAKFTAAHGSYGKIQHTEQRALTVVAEKRSTYFQIAQTDLVKFHKLIQRTVGQKCNMTGFLPEIFRCITQHCPRCRHCCRTVAAAESIQCRSFEVSAEKFECFIVIELPIIQFSEHYFQIIPGKLRSSGGKRGSQFAGNETLSGTEFEQFRTEFDHIAGSANKKFSGTDIQCRQMKHTIPVCRDRSQIIVGIRIEQ